MLLVAPSRWQPRHPPAESRDQGYACLCKGTARHTGPRHTQASGYPWHFLGRRRQSFAMSLLIFCSSGCTGLFCLAVLPFFAIWIISTSADRVSLLSKASVEIIPILIYAFAMGISGSVINLSSLPWREIWKSVTVRSLCDPLYFILHRSSSNTCVTRTAFKGDDTLLFN